MVVQTQDGRFTLAGITSWALGCAQENQPTVFTRISEFQDWIQPYIHVQLSSFIDVIFDIKTFIYILLKVNTYTFFMFSTNNVPECKNITHTESIKAVNKNYLYLLRSCYFRCFFIKYLIVCTLGVSPSLVSRYCEGYSFLQATGP